MPIICINLYSPVPVKNALKTALPSRKKGLFSGLIQWIIRHISSLIQFEFQKSERRSQDSEVRRYESFSVRIE